MEINQYIPKKLSAIHTQDNMINPCSNTSIQDYFGVGLAALGIITTILQKHKVCPYAILDIPSGYGRVCRFLRCAFPTSDIYSSDIMPEAITFCAENFGTIPLLSDDSFSSILQFKKCFNLVFVGSLFTHLPISKATLLTDVLLQTLKSNGLAIITTHGISWLDRISPSNYYGLADKHAAENMRQEFLDLGYSYKNYPNMHNYGVAALDERYFLKFSGIDFYRLPVTWAGQDVYVISLK